MQREAAGRLSDGVGVVGGRSDVSRRWLHGGNPHTRLRPPVAGCGPASYFSLEEQEFSKDDLTAVTKLRGMSSRQFVNLLQPDIYQMVL